MFLGKNSPCWVVWQGLSVSHLHWRSHICYPSLAAHTKETAKSESLVFVFLAVSCNVWERSVTQCGYFRFDYILQHHLMNGQNKRCRWKDHSINIPREVNRWGAWACHCADLKKRRTGEKRVAVGSFCLSITVSHLYRKVFTITSGLWGNELRETVRGK